MFNHGRTLILNESAVSRPALGVFGEEYVPPEYLVLIYPNYLADIRQVLIGSAGDPLYQNYRLAQLMGVAHANQYCRDYFLSLDQRFTYAPFGVKFEGLAVGNIVSPLDAMGMTLTALGDPQSNDAVGRAMYQWQVVTASGPRLTVSLLGAHDINEYPLTFVGEESVAVQLENSISLQLHVPTGGWHETASWIVTSVARPTKDLSYILANTEAIVKSVETALISVPSSFKLLWTKGVSQDDKLGGLLAAFVYKAENVRVHGNN